MYIPLYQLNSYDSKEAQETEERWRNNYELNEYVAKLIREGAGEDFLQSDFEDGKLKGFICDMWDLRGILLQGEDIVFPTADNFEAIDFSYGQFYNNTLTNCYFRSTFDFVRFYNCKFIKCTFHFTTWLGCSFENCSFTECDFIEHAYIKNCDFKNTTFEYFFTSDYLFDDCRFDSNSIIADPKQKPNRNVNTKFEKKQLGEFYASVGKAYKAGGIYDQGRKYYYLSRRARTWHSNSNFVNRSISVVNELMTGYGVKPLRPIFNLLLVGTFCAGLFTFYTKNFYHSIIISISALLTMGDSSIYPFPFDVIYLTQGFLGVLFLGLYLTVLANVWFSQR